MKFRNVLLCLGVTLTLVACGGDPRNSFVGDYNGHGSQDMTLNQQVTHSPIDGPQSITLSHSAQKIIVPTGSCNLTASVQTDTSFTFDSMSCPTDFTDAATGTACSLTVMFTGGTGARIGNVITLTLQGTVAGTCNGVPINGSFNQSTTLTRA